MPRRRLNADIIRPDRSHRFQRPPTAKTPGASTPYGISGFQRRGKSRARAAAVPVSAGQPAPAGGDAQSVPPVHPESVSRRRAPGTFDRSAQPLAQRLQPIGGDQPGRRQCPKRLLHIRWQPLGGGYDVGLKRCASLQQIFQRFFGRPGQPVAAVPVPVAIGKGQQPVQGFAQGQSHRREPGKSPPPARRPAVAVARPVAPAIPPGGKAPPNHLAAQAEPIQQQPAVIRYPDAQNFLLHHPGGGLKPLQLFDYRQQPALAPQPRFRRHVLPIHQESDERRRRYRLNLPPQRVYGSPMDPRQNPPVAKLDPRILPIPNRGAVTPPQHYPLILQLPQRISHILRRQSQRRSHLPNRKRPDAIHPPTHQRQYRILPATRILTAHKQRQRRPPILSRNRAGRNRGRPSRKPIVSPTHQTQPFHRRPSAQAAIRCNAANPPRPGQLLHPRLQRQTALRFIRMRRPQRRIRAVRQHAQGQERIVQFVSVADPGPGVFRFLPDRLRVQPGQIAGIFRQSPAQWHRPRPPLLQRRIVQKGVGHRVEYLMRKHRRLNRIAPADFNIARLYPRQHRPAPLQIRRFGKAVPHRLKHQRMVRNFDIAGRRVILASRLRREHRRQQIIGTHPLQRRRHFLAPGMPQNRQSPGSVPPPASAEYRRLQHRLRKRFFDGSRFQVTENILHRHRQSGSQREIQPIVRSRRLQLKIERPADFLAQRHPPSPVDLLPKRSVNHQLHPAAFVKKPLGHHPLLGRRNPQHPPALFYIRHKLPAGLGVNPRLGAHPSAGRIPSVPFPPEL